jgi:hypothetical protein
MTHEIYWLRPERVLYVSYHGYQTPETLQWTLNAMGDEMESVSHHVVDLIKCLEVSGPERGALLKMLGHRAYSHPMAARGVLVGFDPQLSFENEATVMNTRGDKNTMYFSHMNDAMNYPTTDARNRLTAGLTWFHHVGTIIR